jgi:hypothetical protein
MRTNDLVVTGETTYNLLSANDADIAALKVTNVNAQTVGGEILVGDDMRLGADEILYTNKIKSNPAGGTVTVYDNLTVLGTLNYTLPPAPSAVFGTLGDTEIGDLVTDPLDASPPEAANSNLQPAAERVLSAPTINATQWISTPFLTLMGLAQTDKLKVTSNLVPASATDFNNTAFWNEGGAILQGNTYMDCDVAVSGLTTANSLHLTGAEGLPAQNNTGNAYYVGGQGSGISGRVIIGDGTGWEYRYSSRISSTTTDIMTLTDGGRLSLGAEPTTSNPFGVGYYGGFQVSTVNIRSSVSPSNLNHQGTLALLDNEASPTGGKGGSVVFAGPSYDGPEVPDIYAAAGRIRGITNSTSYGGALTFETVSGDEMLRRMTIESDGRVNVGNAPPNGGPYNSVNESFMQVRSTLPHTTTNHSGTLMVLDNSSTQDNVNTGKGGSIVFGGPLHDSGPDYYGAAGRIRGITNTGAYGGSLTIETASGGGNMERRVTIGTSGEVGIGTTTPGRLLDVNGVSRATQMEVEASGSSLLVTPRKRQIVDADGWVTLDPNGGDNSVDNTGLYVWGSCDVEGNFRSLKTGAATTATTAPNLFSGGIGVAAQSVMTGVRVPGNAVVELGWNTAGKETNAGRIGYGTITGAPTQLDIVGAGTTAGSRSVKVWDNLDVVGGVTCSNLSASSNATFRSLGVREGLWALNEVYGTYTGGNQTLTSWLPNTVFHRAGSGTYTDTSPSAASMQTEFLGFVPSAASSFEVVSYELYLENRTPNEWTINLGANVFAAGPIVVAANRMVTINVNLYLLTTAAYLTVSGASRLDVSTVNAGSVNVSGTMEAVNATVTGTLRLLDRGPIFKAEFITITDIAPVTLALGDCVPGVVVCRSPEEPPGDLTDQLPTASNIIANISGAADSAWYVHFVHGANFGNWTLIANTGINLYGNNVISFASTRIALFRVYLSASQVDVIFL